MTNFIYLSPHLDDAALSCGGHIAQQARRGKRVLAVTVCAGDPPTHTVASDFVRELHERWQTSDPVTERRAEDLAAMRTLGADALHLDVPDCVYRFEPHTGRPLYPDRDAIFGTLVDPELVAAVVDHLRRLEPLWGAVVYTPLGAGHHVDHQLTRLAAEKWGAPGGQLVYYEDYPYAAEPAMLESVVAGSNLTSTAIPLSQADMDCKIAAVACYRSQLSTFYQDQADMAWQLVAFAQARSEDAGLAERVWHAGSR